MDKNGHTADDIDDELIKEFIAHQTSEEIDEIELWQINHTIL